MIESATPTTSEPGPRYFPQEVPPDCALAGGTCNVMLVGSRAATQRVIAAVRPQLAEPVVNVAPRATALPMVEQGGTLIVDGLEQFTADDQRSLFELLGSSRSRVRVISTASGPLLGAIARGEFLEALYYRLNTVYVDLTGRTAD